MIVNCPNCSERFQILVKPVEQRLAGSSIHESSIVTPNVLRAVEEFVDGLGPGRRSNRDLHMNYTSQQIERGWPKVSRIALGKALRRLGATPWRDATERGYDIPAENQTHDVIPVKTKHHGEIQVPVSETKRPFEVEGPADWQEPAFPEPKRAEASPFRYEHQDEYDEQGNPVAPF
jgi:hypothetical protein